MKNKKMSFYILLFAILFSQISCQQSQKNQQQNTGQNKQAAVPTLDELAADWMEVSTLRNMPSINNFYGGLAVTGDMCSVKLLTLPPFVQNGQNCESFLNDKALNSKYSRWYPYQVLRKTTVDGIEVLTTTRMVFEDQGVLLRTVLKNKTQKPQNIEFKLDILGHSRKFNQSWGWSYPRVNDDQYSISAENNCLVINDKKSDAHTVFSFPSAADNLEVDNHKGLAKWNLTIAGKDSLVIEYVMAIGDDTDKTLTKAKQWSNDFEKTFTRAKTLWEKRWNDVFTPHNKHFSGHLPTLVTDDAKLRRVYYMDIASTLQLYRTNLPAAKHAFATNGPEWGVTTVYFWNMEMWTTAWAMLDPVPMKEMIKKWLLVDYHQAISYDCMKGEGSGGWPGRWYSANDWSIFRCIDSYLRVTGDVDFLKEKVGNRTVMEHYERLATSYRQFVNKGDILADYGGPANLLECVPTYTNRVASFNAANVWMLRNIAGIYKQEGNTQKANELNEEADNLLKQILKLYAPGEGVWYSLHRDGKKMEMRHVLDFVMVGKTIDNDLTPQTKKEMIAFVERELLTKYWMRAQSLKDPAAANSDRPDHGPMGSFDAWAPLSMEIMCRFGAFDKALSFLHNIEGVTHEGPFAQSHELMNREFDATPRIARRGQQNFNDAGMAFTEVIIKAFFGFEPQIKGDFKILEPNNPRGFNGVLKNIPYHNAEYNLISDDKGIHIKQN